MNYQAILFEDNSVEKYPVVVFDNKLNITFFNSLSASLFNGIKTGAPVSDYCEITELQKLIDSHLPCPSAVIVKDAAYLASFCPVINGYDIFYVLTVLPHSAEPGAEVYMMSKLNALRNCTVKSGLTKFRKSVTESKLQGHLEQLCKSIRQCEKISEATENTPSSGSSVKLGDMLGSMLNYYQKLRFNDLTNHFSLECSCDTVRLTPLLGTVLVGAFHFIICASVKPYAYVIAEQHEEITEITVSCVPARKYGEKTGIFDDASLYRYYGFYASDIIYIRRLAEANGWKCTFSYIDNKYISLKLGFSENSGNNRVCNISYITDNYENAYNAVDILLK